MNCLYYISWPIIFFINILYFTIPVKISLNALSFYHCLVTTILSKLYLHNLESTYLHNTLVTFSSSYFIWDSMQIIIRKRWKEEWAYLYHHFVILFMLYQLNNKVDTYLLTNILFLGELSNVFNYIVYYMIKTKDSKKNILIISTIQMIWFIYFRVYKFTEYIIMNLSQFQKNNYLLVAFLLTIYIMGFMWGIGQMKNLFTKTKEYIRIKNIKKKTC